MPCYIRILQRLINRVAERPQLGSPPRFEPPLLFANLEFDIRAKLEELTRKSIESHQEITIELERLEHEDPEKLWILIKWLLELLYGKKKEPQIIYT